MGEGVSDLLAELEILSPASAPVPFDRVELERRARRYLSALGVRAEDERLALSQVVLKRVELRIVVGQLGDPLEAAIEETHLLLDQWLVAELDLDGDSDALSAARAAVLGGDVAGWTRRWAGLSQASLAQTIRAARVSAVPERAPLVMDANPIELCCHRSGPRLLARVGRLLGIRGKSARSNS
ncbi:hypothetical protein [Thiocystis violacea]|uniref:hypothetical protein n=1 Tax=Thiocystis violacea TaxID=13725 RepID=UPI00190597CF|nr:hypothetical protein [Thiocystis violacea]MBK1723814.1 hypothetical protein [Thiocystis violacea]